MADPGAPTPKRTQIDALVLACSNSRLKDVVGTDALRSVLDVEYRDLTAAGVFDLQTIWELFEEQPGFDAEAAQAPLARFKLWEKRIGIEVKLPAAMRSLSSNELSLLAAQCTIPAREQQRLFRGSEAKPGRTSRLEVDRPSRASKGRASPSALTPARRRALEIVCGVVALVGLGFGGMTLYSECNREAKWSGISNDFAGDIPIARSERIGDQVAATLSDAGWSALPEPERREQLEQALRVLAERGVNVLVVRAGSDDVVATAQFKPGTDEVHFTFK